MSMNLSDELNKELGITKKDIVIKSDLYKLLSFQNEDILLMKFYTKDYVLFSQDRLSSLNAFNLGSLSVYLDSILNDINLAFDNKLSNSEKERLVNTIIIFDSYDGYVDFIINEFLKSKSISNIGNISIEEDYRDLNELSKTMWIRLTKNLEKSGCL